MTPPKISYFDHRRPMQALDMENGYTRKLATTLKYTLIGLHAMKPKLVWYDSLSVWDPLITKRKIYLFMYYVQQITSFKNDELFINIKNSFKMTFSPPALLWKKNTMSTINEWIKSIVICFNSDRNNNYCDRGRSWDWEFYGWIMVWAWHLIFKKSTTTNDEIVYRMVCFIVLVYGYNLGLLPFQTVWNLLQECERL